MYISDTHERIGLFNSFLKNLLDEFQNDISRRCVYMFHCARVLHRVFHRSCVLSRAFHRVFYRARVFHRALHRVFHRVTHRVFHLVFQRV